MRSLGILGALVLLLALCGLRTALAGASPPFIAVVVSPTHKDTMGLQELALIYRKKKAFWSDNSRITAVNLPSTHPLRRRFSQSVLGANPEELEKYWNDRYFHGVSPPFVLTSEEAVLRFVAQTPGAVGYVSFCNADARVKIALVLSDAWVVSEERARQACEH